MERSAVLLGLDTMSFPTHFDPLPPLGSSLAEDSPLLTNFDTDFEEESVCLKCPGKLVPPELLSQHKNWHGRTNLLLRLRDLVIRHNLGGGFGQAGKTGALVVMDYENMTVWQKSTETEEELVHFLNSKCETLVKLRHVNGLKTTVGNKFTSPREGESLVILNLDAYVPPLNDDDWEISSELFLSPKENYFQLECRDDGALWISNKVETSSPTIVFVNGVSLCGAQLLEFGDVLSISVDDGRKGKRGCDLLFKEDVLLTSDFCVQMSKMVNNKPESSNKQDEYWDKKLYDTLRNLSHPSATAVLNDFDILGFLGQGTFGSVWKVSCGGKEYAMKQIDGESLMYDTATRILLEIDILITLDPHPNIVELIHCIYDETVFLVFELCLGTLWDVRDFYHFPINAFITQMGNALGHLQRNGIAHLDVKPNNILIANNNFKLCDLGSALYVSEDSASDYFARDWYGVGSIILWLHLTQSGQDDLAEARMVHLDKALLDLDPLLISKWKPIEELVLGLLGPENRPCPESWKSFCFGADEMEIEKMPLFEPPATERQFNNKYKMKFRESYSYSKPL